MKPMTIGQVASRVGIGVETVRFYEREGLLDQPVRRESGYRQFDESAVVRLRFIRRAKDLGFTLGEIRELIALGEDPEATRADVCQRAEAKIADIEDRVRDLLRIKDALSALVRACDRKGPAAGCPILHALDAPEAES